jgi:capsular polysaccharide export protein
MAGASVAILSSGVWRLRHLIKEMTGLKPVLLRAHKRSQNDNIVAIAGWGHKPTAHVARELASAAGKPYIAIEDGFLRSVRPGPRELPLSLVFDTAGVHYDPNTESELERLITSAAGRSRPAIEARARAGMARIRELGISKYNGGPRLSPSEMGLGRPPRGGRVLVVDQTMGDGSVLCGPAGAHTFGEMLAAALDEHPDAQIIVKTHPEVVGGRKRGYLGNVQSQDGRIRVVDFDVNPWSLIDVVDHTYVVSSQLGFEALMGGCKVTCFGGPFYAGWGLTSDRASFPRRQARPTLEQLFAAVYLDYARYIDPFRMQQTSFESAVDELAWRRDHALSGHVRRRALINGYRMATNMRAMLAA